MILTPDKMRRKALKKMHDTIGVPFQYKDCFQNNQKGKPWYQKHTWTVGQENDFKVWLVKELKKNGLKKAMAEKTADWFILQYGWKTELPKPVQKKRRLNESKKENPKAQGN